MNRLSECKHAFRRLWPGLTILVFAACGMSDSESAGREAAGEYEVHYTITPAPAASIVHVELRLKQARALLRELSFTADKGIKDIKADGQVIEHGDRITWHPPATGGALAWQATVSSQRGKGQFDALLSTDWGIFRMEDVIPRARTRTLKGAVSRTSFDFSLPPGWSAVTEYTSIDTPIAVDRSERRFDQPTGWIAVGDLGVRRETIAGTRVAIAAPRGEDMRRMDMLALLNWTLPELAEILPDALPRLTIVGAGDPMWRGGLSAPASFFLHAGRPLISENATSALLHEVMHTALGVTPRAGYDWIVEGLAEYYSIELLRRGRAITADRASTAMRRQHEWAEQAETLCADASTAARTALAVTVFAALDRELSAATDGEAGLDDLLPALVRQDVDLAVLTALASDLMGAPPDVLHIDKLPGCNSIP
jgi:hypothetical protein